MALTVEQLRARDQVRRLAAVPPSDEPAGGAPTGQRSLIISAKVARAEQSEAWTAPSPTIMVGARLSCRVGPVGSPLTMQLLRDAEVVDTITIPAGQTGPVVHDLAVAIGRGQDISANTTSVGSTTPAQRVRLQIDLGP